MTPESVRYEKRIPRILVVDNHEAIRGVIKKHFSIVQEGTDSVTAKAALSLTINHWRDAIPLDLSIPGLSGFELCTALSSRMSTRRIPILVISDEHGIRPMGRPFDQ